MATVYDRPIYREGNLVKKMYRSGELIYYRLNPHSETPVTPATPLTFNIISAGTIYWRANLSSYTKDIQYSVNYGPWSSITSSTGGTPISLNAGDVVRFKGDGAISTTTSAYNFFSGSTAVFEASGNVVSLIDSTNYATVTTLAANSFRYLFQGVTGLTSAENLILPATTLADNCYAWMFNGCTSLTTAPELPATTLASDCYYGMFRGCTSLTTAPELPATALAQGCYEYMFYSCTTLTTAPELPATRLADYCYYYMFYRCTSLNYIKCLAIDISADYCTGYWVGNVANSGTFVTPSSTNWTTDRDGIPSGWTRVNA